MPTASGSAVTVIIPVEREAGHAAEGGDVLVLLADRLAQTVDLDVAGQFGQLPGMQVAGAGAHRAP